MNANMIMHKHTRAQLDAPGLTYDLIKHGYMCKCGKLLAAGASCPRVHAPKASSKNRLQSR